MEEEIEESEYVEGKRKPKQPHDQKDQYFHYLSIFDITLKEFINDFMQYLLIKAK